jgi:competence protein ComEC
LAAAPGLPAGDVGGALAGSAVLAVVLLGIAAPRRAVGTGSRSLFGWEAAWLALVGAVAVAAGVGFGTLRIAAVDAGALALAPGPAAIEGYVAAVPRRADGAVAIRVATPDGRLLVEAPEPVPDLDVGAGISATGLLRAPAEFERSYLERLGIRRVLSAREVELARPTRGGLLGVLDEVRIRAQHALSAGTPGPSAALLRGFVLGQDDRIEAATVDEFKESGLAHLLAVSGMNVVLLVILATAVLGVLGVGLRARLVWLLALIALYVLVTGAGPSIQRAGAMGAAGVVAGLAGRPSSRWYALGVAACVTLAVDPRAAGDVGWQLSFAAVLGILLFTAPLSRALAGSSPGAARRALADAAAMTVAATVTTAPLMSFHFGAVSVVALPANLIALPAEAPVMWLGMLAAAAGQIDWLPVAPITWLAGTLAAYIAQVAAWFAAPGWAQLDAGVDGVLALGGVYAALITALALVIRAAGRRRALGPGRRPRRARRRLAAAAGAACLAAAALAVGGPDGDSGRVPGLRVRVLDVGQGDAILLEPRLGDPVLVDAGPPTGAAATRLAELGIDSLAAVVITHADSDHAGGLADVLAAAPAARLLLARADRELRGAAAAAGTALTRVMAGARVRSGALRLEALWPPEDVSVAEPNAASVVLLVRWRGFRMLLTGDAEAEAAPLHPGDVDVLKVAHHGSEDAGLASLLREAQPELGLISVGAENPYGHPAPPTLATLAEGGVPVLRTDEEGELVVSVAAGDWWLGDRADG